MIRPVLALTALSIALPAFAQVTTPQPRRERYIQIAPGERCPRSANPDEEVIVCGERKQEDRYRLDVRFRGPTAEDAQSAEGRVEATQNAGDTGTGSCSNVGPGGFTGCYGQELSAWKAQQRRDRVTREQTVDD